MEYIKNRFFFMRISNKINPNRNPMRACLILFTAAVFGAEKLITQL